MNFEAQKKMTEKELKFAKNRNNAKRNLTRRLARNPTAAEIMGLIAVRRQGRNENQFFGDIMQKAEARAAAGAEAKAAAKAAAAEVRMKQQAIMAEEKMRIQAAKEEAKLMKKAESKAEKNAARALVLNMKKMQKMQNKTAKLETRKLARDVKELAREEAKKQFSMAEGQARENLTRALGKPPRVANIRRLASLRQKGVELSVNDYLKVKNYAGTRKEGPRNSLERFFALNNVKPEVDPCAACELRKFLEKEED
jgi:hypothetical protein